MQIFYNLCNDLFYEKPIRTSDVNIQKEYSAFIFDSIYNI